MSQHHARVIAQPLVEQEVTPRSVGRAAGQQPRMRLIEGGRKPIVEVISTLSENRLYEAYRALRMRGVQVIHTAVRRSGNTLVQLLHLAEADGSDFTSRRLRETMATLRRDCGVLLMHPRRGSVQSWLEPQMAAGGTPWQPYAT